MTAYELQKQANAAIDVTIYEAAERLGGKILTPCFSAHPVSYEAGAAEFYDYSILADDPLKNLVLELGLPIRPMGGSAVIMHHRILANIDDVRDQLGSLALASLLEFDGSAKDTISPIQFYNADNGDRCHTQINSTRFDSLLARISDPQARRFIETMIHSDLATEPPLTSSGYGLQNYLMNDPAYMRLYCIEGGNERLAQELDARVAATRRLSHRVTRIGKTEKGRLCVHSVHEDLPRSDDYDFVVVALPHNHLMSVEYDGPLLSGALQRHHLHHDHPAHYLRISMLFEHPFWKDSLTDSYWMLDQLGGCCMYDESSRDPGLKQGVLGWLLGGEAAERMSERSDDELVATALASLPEFLAHGRSLLIEGRVHRWTRSVSALPGGTAPLSHDQRHCPEPREHQNLFLVGDYLFDSTLNGVLDSAEYVANWIAARLADASVSP